VKQRELELTAARSFQRMKLDLTGQYHWNGFGDKLFGRSESAFEDLFRGDLQGWFIGLELNTPIGNRIGHTAARHAELNLIREKAILEEQERQISHELRAAFTEKDRAYAVSRSTYNRRIAALIQLNAERARNSVGGTRLDLVLDAQGRAVEAEVAFYRAIVDYNLAIYEVHLARGTLLDSLDIYLAEGPWSAEAHRSAARQSRRFRSPLIDYRLRRLPHPISQGVFMQDTEPEIAGEPGSFGLEVGDVPSLEPTPAEPPADDAAESSEGESQ
jgi:hypothetical protein